MDEAKEVRIRAVMAIIGRTGCRCLIRDQLGMILMAKMGENMYQYNKTSEQDVAMSGYSDCVSMERVHHAQY